MSPSVREVNIPFPARGLDLSTSPSKKDPLGTIEAANVRLFNPRNGKRVGARRPGTRKFAPVTLGLGPARGLASVPYDISHIFFEALGTPTTAWKAAGASGKDALSVKSAATGDEFFLEGGSHVTVRNSAGNTVATITLPLESGQQARALAIDDLGRIYVGTSTGRVQSQSRVWCYVDDPRRGWQKLWELRPGVYVEKLLVDKSTLYLLANDDDRNRAYVVGVVGLSDVPEEAWRAQVPAPGNAFDVSVNGDIIVASGFNANRGVDPLVPGAGPSLDDEFADWLFSDIAGFEGKRWTVLRAEDIALEDEDEVVRWSDPESPREVFVAPEIVNLKALRAFLGGAQPADGDLLTFTSSDESVTETWRFVNAIAQKGDIDRGATLNDALVAFRNAVLNGGNGTTSHEQTEASALITTGPVVNSISLELQARAQWDYVTAVNTSATLTYTGGVLRSEKAIQPTPGVLKKHGLSGRPELFFNGRSNKYATERNATTAINQGDQQHTLIPAFGVAGNRDVSAKFAFFMVCRPFEAGLRSTLLAQKTATQIRRVVTNKGASGTSSSGDIAFVEDAHAGSPTVYATNFTTNNATGFVLVEIQSYPSTTATNNDVELYINAALQNGPTPPDAAENQGLDRTTLGQCALLADQGIDDGWYYGGISEILVLRANENGNLLSTAQRQLIEGRLAWKYGAQDTLPATHPYKTIPPPPPGGSVADFNKAQRLLSPTPILTKLRALTHEIAWVAASDLVSSPANTIGALGSGVVWNKAGTAVYTAGVPVLMAGPGSDTASVRMILDLGDDYDVTNGWGYTLGTQQNESFSYDKLELAIDDWDHVLVPFHAERFQGEHKQFLMFDATGTLLYAPSAEEGQLSFSVSVHKPTPPGFAANTPAIEVPELVNVACRLEATNVLTMSSLPVDGDSVTFLGTVNGVATGETYTWAALLTGVGNEIQLDTTVAGCLANLKAGTNALAGSGTLYGTGTARSELVSATTQHGVTLTFAARQYETQTSASASTLAITFSSGRFLPGTGNARQMRLVQSQVSAESGTAYIQTGVANGTFCEFSNALVQPVPGGSNVLVAAPRYMHSAVINGKVYTTDGSKIWVWDPRLRKFEQLKATGKGTVPERALMLEAWRVRLVALGIAGYPYSIRGSRVGNQTDWDLQPPNITGTQSFDLALTRTGNLPVIATGFIPYIDDLAVVLADPGVYILRGDPAPGANGQLDPVTMSVGGAFGRAWAIGPKGEIFFWSSQGRLMGMVPGGMPETISDERVSRVFEEIDLSKFYVRMAWNWRYHGLDIATCPYGGVDEPGRYFFWERDSSGNNGFWEEPRTALGHSPTDLIVIDAERPQDRRTLIARADGVVCTFDDNAVDDDGEPIHWKVLLGPIAFGDTRRETKLSRLQILLDTQSGDTTVELWSSETPNDKGARQKVGTLRPGLNRTLPMKGRGGFLWLLLFGSGHFAFEAARALVEPGAERHRRALA